MKLAPCPFCGSSNVKRYLVERPRRTDPGCEDCKKSAPIREWRLLVEAGGRKSGTLPGEADFFPPRKAQRPVPELVNPDDSESRSIWCEELGISSDDLRRAVALVGPMPNALRFYFRKGAPKVQQDWSRPQRAPRAKLALDDPAPLNPDRRD